MAWPCTLLLLSLLFSAASLLPAPFSLWDVPAPSSLSVLFSVQGTPLFSPSSSIKGILYTYALFHHT